MGRTTTWGAFLLLVGTLLQVQAGPMRDKIDGLTGFSHESPSEHHHGETDHAHDHAHAHDHDHDHHKGHSCIHDKIKHPPLMRNFLNVHGASGASASDAAAPLALRVETGRQLLEDGRVWSSPLTDAGDSNYDADESSCLTVGSTNKGNLRLHTKDAGITGLSTAKQEYLKNVLMPAVKDYFQATLTVVQLTTNLVVSSAVGTISGTTVTVENSDRTTGFAASDYLLYYTATQTSDCATGVIAYASVLEITECDRPLVGYINFCPDGITTTDVSTADHQSQLSTGKHEVTHALGYTSRMYAYWRTTSMAPRTSRDGNGVPNQGKTTVALSDNGVDSTATYEIYTPDPAYFWSYTDSVLGGTRWKFKSDNILTKARAHFGCSDLDGVEVENQGAGANWGSHWEKRIIGNEYMAAQTSEIESIVSEISLAAFEDMGWWGVAYNQAEVYDWMKNAGCDTITQKCLTNGVPINSEYFCNETDSGATGVKMCTSDGAAVGYCTKGTQSGLASYYYYFGDTTTAGSDISMYADYCPTVAHYTTLICSGKKTNGDAIVGGVDYTLGQGQEYSSNSRCFGSTLTMDSQVTNVNAGTAGCYKFQCLSTSQLQIDIYSSTSQSYTKTCTTAIAGQSLSVDAFVGSITCPDPAATTVCGADQSFPSLTNMTVAAGAIDLTPYLTPPFDISITSYKLNIGAVYSSLSITPTTTSSSAMTMTFTDRAGFETIGAGGVAYGTSLIPNYNTFSFKLATTAGQERTYSVAVVRGMGNNSTKTMTVTLNLVYSSVTDWTAFRTAITAELLSIMEIQDSSTLAVYQISEGSIKVQFTLTYIDDTQPEPYALDATFQSLFNDKNSVMFSGTYSYLKYASGYSSTDSVNYCDGADNTCSAEYCNVETGVCTSSGSSSDDDFPDWALYVVIGVGCLLVVILLGCVIKCIYNCCSSTAADKPVQQANKKPHKPALTIDRPAGKKQISDAKHIRLAESPCPDSPVGDGRTGKFAAMMNDDSSDDDVDRAAHQV